MIEEDKSSRAPFPPLYFDYLRMNQIPEWSLQELEEKTMMYGRFILEDLMPRAREETEALMTRLLFELAYREGVYE